MLQELYHVNTQAMLNVMQRNQATSPTQPMLSPTSTLSNNMELQKVQQPYVEDDIKQKSPSQAAGPTNPPTPSPTPGNAFHNHLENDQTQEQCFAMNDTEKREGDAKVKEGLAFLRKFYNERASVFSAEKRRNSNQDIMSVTGGVELL